MKNKKLLEALFNQISSTFCRLFPFFRWLAVNSGATPLCSNPPSRTCIFEAGCESAADYGEETFPLTQTCIFKVMAISVVFDVPGSTTWHRTIKCEVHYDADLWWKLRLFILLLLNWVVLCTETQYKMVTMTIQHIKKIYSFVFYFPILQRFLWDWNTAFLNRSCETRCCQKVADVEQPFLALWSFCSYCLRMSDWCWKILYRVL